MIVLPDSVSFVSNSLPLTQSANAANVYHSLRGQRTLLGPKLPQSVYSSSVLNFDESISLWSWELVTVDISQGTRV